MPSFTMTRVESERLVSSATSIHNNINDIQTSINRIKDAIVGTLSPTWEGPAKDRFFLQYDKDTSFFKQCIIEETNLNENLRTAARQYTSADNLVHELVSKLKI